MVRTYQFNPSTQHSDHYLPGATKYSNNHLFLSIPKLDHIQQPPHSQSSPKSHHLPFHDSILPQSFDRPSCSPSTYYKNDEKQQSLESSTDSSGISGSFVVNARKMSDDQTAIFGIRSVIIDGQRFYQPLNPELNDMLSEQFASIQHSNRKRSHSLDTKRNNVTAMFGAMAVASQNQKHREKTDFTVERTSSFCDQSTANVDNYEQKKMIEDFGLPWAKGSLQPRNGKRSSNGWNLGQRNIPPGNSFNSTALTDVLKPYNNNSPQFDNSFTTYTKKPSNIYQTVSEEAYSYAPRPIDYPINPRSSFNSFAVDLPSTYVNPNLHGNTPEEHRRFEKEQHRIDLLRQIEDNQRREQMRKHEEWQEEERERWRSELTLRRQRAEVEREQDEVRQRQLAAEFKAQQAAFEVPCEKENTKRNVSKRQRSQEAVAPSRRDSIDSKPRLEWWEKKSAWGDKRISSPVIPTHRERRQSNPSRASRVSGRESVRSDLISASRSGVPAKFNRSGSPPSRQSRSHSRSSRRGYQPSIASRAGSDSSALRRLSITRRNLELEREVLRSAVDKNKYDDHVFESKGRR